MYACLCVCVPLVSRNEGGQLSWERQLELAVAWNRVDIAESEIFTEESQWKVGIQHSSKLHFSLKRALCKK